MCCGGKTWTTNVETVAGLAPMGVDVDLLLDPDPDNGLQLLPDSLWARAADGATVRLTVGSTPVVAGAVTWATAVWERGEWWDVSAPTLLTCPRTDTYVLTATVDIPVSALSAVQETAFGLEVVRSGLDDGGQIASTAGNYYGPIPLRSIRPKPPLAQATVLTASAWAMQHLEAGERIYLSTPVALSTAGTNYGSRTQITLYGLGIEDY